MDKSLSKWEYWGIAVISTVGSLLHFTFAWLGKLAFVGIFAAVNESVWEHLKIAFWPMFIYAIIEYGVLKNSRRNFWFAKSIGIFAVPIIIVVIFYSYTAVIGHEILAVDISSFIVAIALGQIISRKIIAGKQTPGWLNYAGIALILLYAISFAVFTFYPPHLPLFLDRPTGTYGFH
ncbi:MAG: DUF6512 family protein [Dehalococcoidales bacterium]|nr:DUF6512 family protein [Dehalococcoidales bacterium]